MNNKQKQDYVLDLIIENEKYKKMNAKALFIFYVSLIIFIITIILKVILWIMKN